MDQPKCGWSLVRKQSNWDEYNLQQSSCARRMNEAQSSSIKREYKVKAKTNNQCILYNITKSNIFSVLQKIEREDNQDKEEDQAKEKSNSSSRYWGWIVGIHYWKWVATTENVFSKFSRIPFEDPYPQPLVKIKRKMVRFF